MCTAAMSCPMRHNTPIGSMITKSRMPHDLSAGGSTLAPYLATSLVLNIAPPSLDVLNKQMHLKLSAGSFLYERCKRKLEFPCRRYARSSNDQASSKPK